MRILLLTDEVWNNKIHGNNVLSNWFEGMDAEFANIYCSPGEPDNLCCEKYFQITDTMMFKSILGGKKAGRSFTYIRHQEETNAGAEVERKKFYAFMKSITTESVRALREWIWMHGRYDIEKMREFIEVFNPDIVYSPRLATRKLLRLEKIVHQITDAPFVAFTADDEYTLKQVRFSPVYWIRRGLTRHDLRENVKFYTKYFMFSKGQAEYYEKEFGIETECLYKNGVFPDKFEEKEMNNPIRIIYGGKLYCNRYKVLAKIGKALAEINTDGTKAVLEIYTKDSMSVRQQKMLNDGKNIFVKGAVTADELSRIYQESDVALHVESQDLKNRLLTRFSFSTKIIDCLASGCAVMAVCWEGQSGLRYLQEADAAICIGDESKIKDTLKKLIEKPEMIREYQKKAWECGRKNHEKVAQQGVLLAKFGEIICRE